MQHVATRHCIDQWLLQKAGWVHYQGLTTLYKLHTHWNHARHQWCVIKNRVKFLSADPELLDLFRVNINAACCNEALYWPMIVTEGWLGPLPRSDNPLQATYTLEPCQTSMMCHQKCSQIFVRSGTSWPVQSEYQCSMLQRGTVLTNDCYRRLVGSITKVWQPFTSYIHTGTMPDINDVSSKIGSNFCQIWNFLTCSEWISMQHVATRHCIDQWLLQKAGWVHYQGLTTLYKLHTHWNHARHQWCVIKNVVKFLSDPELLDLFRVNISAACCNEALYWPMIVTEGWLGPLPRSDNPLQATYTLEQSNFCQHIRDGFLITE